MPLPASSAVVADAGCRTFIVHARKAWLQGLSARSRTARSRRCDYALRASR